MGEGEGGGGQKLFGPNWPPSPQSPPTLGRGKLWSYSLREFPLSVTTALLIAHQRTVVVIGF